ncbi:MAG: hypothetical protein ACTHJW_28850 [Streptosporangiaceae bacterium]
MQNQSGPMRNRWIIWLLSPIGLLLLSAFRLLVVSRYNTTTAIAIAESGGYINTLLGSVIPLLPIFVPYLALILLLAEQYTLTIIAFAFTVVISPTRLRLPVTARLAKLDEHALLNVAANQEALTIAILVVALLVASWHHRSFTEGISTTVVLAVALALAAAPFVIHPTLPEDLRAAFTNIHNLFAWIPRDSTLIVQAALAVLVAILLLSNLTPKLVAHGMNVKADSPITITAMTRVTAFAVAVAAAISFFPYLYNIYPLPKHQEYYVTVLRQPWLQTEKITLTSGHVDIGYVLSTADYWFTVLLAKNRTIVYIRDADVASRSVCQPKHVKSRRLPPLIPVFYSPPPRIQSCGHS